MTWNSLGSLCLLAGLTGTLSTGCNRKSDDGPGTAAPGATASAQSSDDKNAVLANVGDYTITVGEFQAQINKQSPYIRPRYTSLEQKREFLDNMIRFEVLAREAAKRGLDKDPDVVRTMKQVMIQKLMKDEFERKLTPDDIPEDELRKYYEEHKSEYSRAPEVRAMAVVTDDADKAAAVAKEAKTKAGTTNKGFRALVRKHSTDEETKRRDGDLRYFRADSTAVPEAVRKAAFALAKTGDVTGPIDAGNGNHYIIKLTGRRDGVDKDFDAVKRQIKNRVYRQTRSQAHKDFIAKLRQDAKVEILEDNFKKVRIDTSKPVGKDGKPVGFEADGHGHGSDH